MNSKFEINNSENFEYLIHGQVLSIKFYIPNCLFAILIFKEPHTKLWFHKFLSGIYYLAPFIYFYNFLVLKNVLGFKNKNILNTNFEYPGSSYKFNKVRTSIWDLRIKLKFNKTIIQTSANSKYPKYIFIGFGLGITIKKLQLNINNLDVIDSKINAPVIKIKPILANVSNQKLISINPIKIKPNSIIINKINLKSKINHPICNLNTKELYKYN
jgi:hypothetical protein